MPFLTCGYPSEVAFQDYITTFVDSGADVIEIGFPHSDPLADGPIIQVASQKAIAKGFSLARGFDLIARLTARHSVPLVIMCYANMIHRLGYDKFVRRAVAAGVAGLIVPDMIVEESKVLRREASKQKLDCINLVTPTTNSKRAAQVAATSSGFLYLVSVAGTTGMRSKVSHNLLDVVGTVRAASNIPICVGFGVSSPAMARKLSTHVDGVIIGSALINIIESDGSGKGREQVRKFLLQTRKQLGESK
jgi:tryptophan synthase alpha chain